MGLSYFRTSFEWDIWQLFSGSSFQEMSVHQTTLEVKRWCLSLEKKENLFALQDNKNKVSLQGKGWTVMLPASLNKFVVSETWSSSPGKQSSECKDATWPLLHCHENKELAQMILL